MWGLTHGNLNGQVSVQVVLKEGLFTVGDSFTWEFKEAGFTGVVYGDSFAWKFKETGFTSSSLNPEI